MLRLREFANETKSRGQMFDEVACYVYERPHIGQTEYDYAATVLEAMYEIAKSAVNDYYTHWLLRRDSDMPRTAWWDDAIMVEDESRPGIHITMIGSDPRVLYIRVWEEPADVTINSAFIFMSEGKIPLQEVPERLRIIASEAFENPNQELYPEDKMEAFLSHFTEMGHALYISDSTTMEEMQVKRLSDLTIDALIRQKHTQPFIWVLPDTTAPGSYRITWCRKGC